MTTNMPTLDNIANLPNAGLVEVIWGCISGAESKASSIFWQVELINMEVCNGGLVQYFQNTRGEDLDEATAALRAIGAPKHLSVFERAVAIYREERAQPGGCWEEDLGHRPYEESRIDQMDKVQEWDIDAIIDIEAAWIRSHANEFASDG